MDTFRLHTISTEVVEATRECGVDFAGNRVEQAHPTGGEPLRCCQRTPGERLILFGYRPALPPTMTR